MNAKEKQDKNIKNGKVMLEEIMQFYVTLKKEEIGQYKIIKDLVDKFNANAITFQQMMKMLLSNIKQAKSKERKATLAKVFNIIKTHYDKVEK
jgi:hypothetical protein